MPARAPCGSSPPQSEAQRKPGLAESYAALETLLRKSPRGRWFLAEYARRNRTAETELLLEALARIETAVTKPVPRHGAPGNIFAELIEMSEAIARTRREIAHIRPPHQLDQFDQQLFDATVELDHIVEATEKATSDILAAAEEIQEVAWTLREKGIDIALCDKIDQRATDIYTACSFQDITGQRTEKVVKALRFIEAHQRHDRDLGRRRYRRQGGRHRLADAQLCRAGARRRLATARAAEQRRRAEAGRCRSHVAGGAWDPG
ncbi:MAG TPA: hypothetical protein VEW64_08400 [Methyloceanibacter sp.]|jgi:hypothetical protein|nr:hypothetical protein [Methyloceanibacter sp.]